MSIEGDDEDFPLADHPGPGGPKAGDREMNRARDLGHLDVAGGRPPSVKQDVENAVNELVDRNPGITGEQVERTLMPTPSNNPVVAAWQAFKGTDSYAKALNDVTNSTGDPLFMMFMAGYAARDSRP